MVAHLPLLVHIVVRYNSLPLCTTHPTGRVEEMERLEEEITLDGAEEMEVEEDAPHESLETVDSEPEEEDLQQRDEL